MILAAYLSCATVLTVEQPKAPPSKPLEPATPAKAAAASTPAPPAAPAQSATSNTSQPPATPSPAPVSTAASNAATFNDPSALAMGEQRAAAIANMEAMGFPRDQIDSAMRAAFFNPDRAVEYLLNGIPDSARQEQRAAAAASPRPTSQQAQQPAATAGMEAAQTGTEEPVNLFEQAAAAQTGGGRGGATRGAAAGAGAPGGAGALPEGAGSALDFLRNNPQFQQLRQVVQQQPQMLEPILQQVAAGNPQLAQIITQNPEQFMQLLAEDSGEDVAMPPGAQQISVTEEEREAIERVSTPMYLCSHDDSLIACSFAVWASSVIWSSRPTSRATRTRSWPRTSCSSSLTTILMHQVLEQPVQGTARRPHLSTVTKGSFLKCECELGLGKVKSGSMKAFCILVMPQLPSQVASSVARVAISVSGFTFDACK